MQHGYSLTVFFVFLSVNEQQHPPALREPASADGEAVRRTENAKTVSISTAAITSKRFDSFRLSMRYLLQASYQLIDITPIA